MDDMLSGTWMEEDIRNKYEKLTDKQLAEVKKGFVEKWEKLPRVMVSFTPMYWVMAYERILDEVIAKREEK